MKERTFKSAQNLEARIAALFVQNANKFQSRIKITSGNKSINGKSMMGVISMTIYEGEEIKITADGPDEQEAIDSLAHMLSF